MQTDNLKIIKMHGKEKKNSFCLLPVLAFKRIIECESTFTLNRIKQSSILSSTVAHE